MPGPDLLRACEECYRTFDPSAVTEGSHADAFCQRLDDAGDAAFVREVFFGCMRYKAMLEVLVKSYLSVHHRLLSDLNKYLVVGYLLLVRLGELGAREFRRLCGRYLSASVLAEYIRFVFDPAAAREHCVAGWLTVYDDDFVQTRLLGHIEEHRAEMAELADEIDSLSLGAKRKAQDRETKPPTRVEPFALTKPRPRLLPEPEPLPEPQRPNRPKDAATDEAIEAIQQFAKGKKCSTLSKQQREANRAQEQAQEPRPPQLRTLNRPSNTAAVLKRLEEEHEQVTRPEYTTFKPPEVVRAAMERPPAEGEVRLTAAAIIREDAVWRKREEERARELKKKESELRDSGDFFEWQRQMQEQDRKEREAKIALRKLEMQLCDENARAVREKLINEHSDVAKQYKQEQQEELDRAREEARAEAEALRRKAQEEYVQAKERVKSALDDCQQAKAARAQQIKKEREQNEIRLAQMLELERQRKQELIAEIRALEANRPNHGVYKAELDPESKSGQGMLNEMSLAELRQKLQEVRAEREDEERARRDAIQQAKAEREQGLQQRLQHIQEKRTAMQRHREAQRSDRQQAQDAQARARQAAEEQQLLELQQRLQAKRQERLEVEAQHRQEEKERRVKAQLLSADKLAMEFKRWQEMEKGAGNTALLRQARRGEEAGQREGQQQRDAELRQRQLLATQRAAKSARRAADDNFQARQGAWQAQERVEQSLREASTLSEKQRKMLVVQQKLEDLQAARHSLRAVTA